MADDVEKWEQQLDKEWDKARIDIGNPVMRATLLREAKAKSMLGGEWEIAYKVFLVRKNLGESAVNRLIKIAEYPLFMEAQHQALIPNSSWAAHQITLIPTEKARCAFESGEVNAEMSVKEAEALKKKLVVVTRSDSPPGSSRKISGRKKPQTNSPRSGLAQEIAFGPENTASAPKPRSGSSEEIQQRIEVLEKHIAGHVAKCGNKVSILYELQDDILKEMEIRSRIMDVLSKEFGITKSATTILNIEDEEEEGDEQ